MYFQVLGGHRHLAWKLGEMARGLRILRIQSVSGSLGDGVVFTLHGRA